jgi:hypothetical protein
MNIPAARIGQWYENLDTDEVFFVTGYDDKSHTIELQSIDGDVSEIDVDTWSALALKPCEQAEVDSGDPGNFEDSYRDDLMSAVERFAQR